MIAVRRRTLYSILVALFLLTSYHLLLSTSIVSLPRPQEVPTTNSATAQRTKWNERPIRYPVTSLLSVPTNAPYPIPPIQFPFEAEDARSKEVRERRRQAVKEAFTHSWNEYAWLKDEVAPVTGDSRSTFGGWGATLVDTLDTLWIMGMREEFEEAVSAVGKIDFSIVEQLPLNIFETTIRYLGGLLGAFDVSEGKYPVLLSKAVEVGDMLYVAFDTPNRMPITRWNANESPQQTEALEKLLWLRLDHSRWSILVCHSYPEI